MRICFLCDLHLSENTDTLQYDVLDWVLCDLMKKRPDCVAFVGDASCDGSDVAYAHLVRRMRQLRVPFLYIPGNSDLRSPLTREQIQSDASPLYNSINGTVIFAVNDAEGTVSEAQLSALSAADEDSIVFMHHPPRSHNAEGVAGLLSWRAAHPQTMLFYGHLHRFFADGCEVSLPALDPDKSIGEPPCTVYYDTDTRQIEKSHYPVSVSWDMYSYFGISCYRVGEQISFARERGLKYLELRPSCIKAERDALCSQIQKWREGGGEHLSVHLPDVGYKEGEVFFEEGYDELLEVVALLGADRVTQHVPKVALEQIQKSPAVLDEIALAVSQKLNALPHAITVGVENMHMTATETAVHRRFGYTPEECLAFMKALRERCRHRVGINFDIGHARNNAPFSQRYQISTWLSMLGEHIVGYHLHQVTYEDGRFENHMPLTHIYGSLISYASFFKYWEMGKIAKAPLIFEMRPEGAYEITLATFAAEKSKDREV